MFALPLLVSILIALGGFGGVAEIFLVAFSLVGCLSFVCIGILCEYRELLLGWCESVMLRMLCKVLAETVVT